MTRPQLARLAPSIRRRITIVDVNGIAVRIDERKLQATSPLPWRSQNGNAGLNQGIVNHLAVSCLEPDGGSRNRTGNAVQVHAGRCLDQPERDGIGQEADSRWEDFRIAPEAKLLLIELC
jgi:hypothetical protein